jgi:hypothetical protein
MKELSKNIKSRVVETLSLIASEELQLQYQSQVPQVNVSDELFNQWDDCYYPGDPAFHAAFREHELASLASFDEILNQVSSATSQQLPRLEEFMRTREWQQLASAARSTGLALVPTDTP